MFAAVVSLAEAGAAGGLYRHPAQTVIVDLDPGVFVRLQHVHTLTGLGADHEAVHDPGGDARRAVQHARGGGKVHAVAAVGLRQKIDRQIPALGRAGVQIVASALLHIGGDLRDELRVLRADAGLLQDLAGGESGRLRQGGVVLISVVTVELFALGALSAQLQGVDLASGGDIADRIALRGILYGHITVAFAAHGGEIGQQHQIAAALGKRDFQLVRLEGRRGGLGREAERGQRRALLVGQPARTGVVPVRAAPQVQALAGLRAHLHQHLRLVRNPGAAAHVHLAPAVRPVRAADTRPRGRRRDRGGSGRRFGRLALHDGRERGAQPVKAAAAGDVLFVIAVSDRVGNEQTEQQSRGAGNDHLPEQKAAAAVVPEAAAADDGQQQKHGKGVNGKGGGLSVDADAGDEQGQRNDQSQQDTRAAGVQGQRQPSCEQPAKQQHRARMIQLRLGRPRRFSDQVLIVHEAHALDHVRDFGGQIVGNEIHAQPGQGGAGDGEEQKLLFPKSGRPEAEADQRQPQRRPGADGESEAPRDQGRERQHAKQQQRQRGAAVEEAGLQHTRTSPPRMR